MPSISPTEFGQRKQLAVIMNFLAESLLAGKTADAPRFGGQANPNSVKKAVERRKLSNESMRPKFHRLDARFEDQLRIPPLLNLKSPEAVQFKNFFKVFKSAFISKFSPKIEIYKIYREIDNYHSFVEIPLDFPTTPMKMDDTQTNYDDEYGIVDFRCTQMSYNDADVTANLRVSLVLYFKNITSLTKDRPIVAGNASSGEWAADALNKILRHNLDRIMEFGGSEKEREMAADVALGKMERSQGDHYRISDLMVLPGTAFRNDGKSVYYAGKHDVKMIFGWNVPETVGGRPLELFKGGQNEDGAWTITSVQSAKDVIEKQNLPVLCELQDHTISFNDDGSIQLSLEFLGKVEATVFAQNLNVFLENRAAFEQTKLLAEEKALLQEKKGKLTEEHKESAKTIDSRMSKINSRERELNFKLQLDFNKWFTQSLIAPFLGDFGATFLRSGGSSWLTGERPPIITSDQMSSYTEWVHQKKLLSIGKTDFLGNPNPDYALASSMGPEQLLGMALTDKGVLMEPEVARVYHENISTRIPGDMVDTVSSWSKWLLRLMADESIIYNQNLDRWNKGVFQFPYYTWPGKILLRDEKGFLATLKYLIYDPNFYNSGIRSYEGTDAYEVSLGGDDPPGYFRTMDQTTERLLDTGAQPVEARQEYLDSVSSVINNMGLQRAEFEKENEGHLGNVPVYFLRMGDIVNAMFSSVNGALGDLKVLFGSMHLKRTGQEPESFEMPGDSRFERDEVGPKKEDAHQITKDLILSLNVLDVPITYENFIGWLTRTIIGPRRFDYTLGDFLKVGVRQLLEIALADVRKVGLTATPSLSTQGYEGTLPMFDFSSVQESLKTSGAKSIKTDMIHLSSLKDKLNKHTGSTGWQKKSLRPIYYLAGRSEPFYYHRKGDLLADMAENIYHFFWGQENGLLLKASFRKQDINGFREATIARAKSEGVDSSFMLVPAYDLTLELIGNTLFVPQSIIYFHPYLLGAQANREKLPIEAYYRVEEVTHSVNSTGYYTTLKCRFAHFPGKGVKTEAKEIKGFPIY